MKRLGNAALEHSCVENEPHIQALPGSLNAGIYLLPIVILVQILPFSSINDDCFSVVHYCFQF